MTLVLNLLKAYPFLLIKVKDRKIENLEVTNPVA
jgi:hypothetical protein